RIDDWEEQRSKRSARLERGGQGLSILKSLEDLRPKTVPLLATYLEKEILEVQPIADQERKAAERAAAQVKLQSELDKLDEIRAQAYPFIQRNDFVGAADLLQKASTDFQVEEARQLLQATREGFLSLQKMKLFLSQSFRSNPFRQGARELGGTVISGSAETLVIQLASGVGQTERTWAQVQPQTLVQMAEQYISAAQMNPREKADLWTAASFFLYVHGGFPRAAAFAQQAVAANPEQAPQIRRLMPGMLSE
ncbi:MAG: hypothetical protein U1E27_03510, partial [Kiritimatiellia bacterium]|nr:hypothetical protein [Kiritimatiellia bacterium]